MAYLLKFLLIFSTISSAFSMDRNELLVGDILLQPLHCWVCNLIEAEEDTIFSHIGIVGEDRSGELVVFEAWQKVKATSIGEYIARTQKDQKISVVRHINFNPERDGKVFSNDFYNKMEGIAYDSEFRIDNDSLYCSELIYILLNPYVDKKIVLKRMPFQVYPELWDRFFKGNTPRGEWGLSPVDIYRHQATKFVGFLE